MFLEDNSCYWQAWFLGYAVKGEKDEREREGFKKKGSGGEETEMKSQARDH